MLSKKITENKIVVLENRNKKTQYSFCWSDAAVPEQARADHLDRCAVIGAAQQISSMTKVYDNMLNRCFGKEKLCSTSSYWGVNISKPWLSDRREFYKWYTDNFYYLSDSEIPVLDKDVKGQNCLNGTYSAEKCLLLPKRINKAIVAKCKVRYDDKLQKYYYINTSIKQKLFFEDINSLYADYCNFKQRNLESIVGEYTLPQEVRRSLKEFYFDPEILKESERILAYREKIRKTLPQNISYFELMGIVADAILLPVEE